MPSRERHDMTSGPRHAAFLGGVVLPLYAYAPLWITGGLPCVASRSWYPDMIGDPLAIFLFHDST